MFTFSSLLLSPPLFHLFLPIFSLLRFLCPHPFIPWVTFCFICQERLWRFAYFCLSKHFIIFSFMRAALCLKSAGGLKMRKQWKCLMVYIFSFYPSHSRSKELLWIFFFPCIVVMLQLTTYIRQGCSRCLKGAFPGPVSYSLMVVWSLCIPWTKNYHGWEPRLIPYSALGNSWRGRRRCLRMPTFVSDWFWEFEKMKERKVKSLHKDAWMVMKKKEKTDVLERK